MKFLEKVEQLQRENEGYIVFVVNGKIICRKMAKKNVVFPTYYFTIYTWNNRRYKI